MDVLQEGVTDSIFTLPPGQAQIPLVFTQYQAPFVQHDSSFARDFEEGSQACPLARGVSVRIAAIGDDGNVRVYDYRRRRHSSWPILRSRVAILVDANSPNLSPKKLSGQFSISPHSLSSRSERRAAPSSIDVK